MNTKHPKLKQFTFWTLFVQFSNGLITLLGEQQGATKKNWMKTNSNLHYFGHLKVFSTISTWNWKPVCYADPWSWRQEINSPVFRRFSRCWTDSFSIPFLFSMLFTCLDKSYTELFLELVRASASHSVEVCVPLYKWIESCLGMYMMDTMTKKGSCLCIFIYWDMILHSTYQRNSEQLFAMKRSTVVG